MMIAAEMLSEPTIVPDIYASGLSHMEDLGDGLWRLTLYSKQESIYGGTEYVVVARIIGTSQAIINAVKTIMQAFGRKCCGGKPVGLVH